MIKMFIVRVAKPKTFKDYPIVTLGAPMCCVARTDDCVTIKNIRGLK